MLAPVPLPVLEMNTLHLQESIIQETPLDDDSLSFSDIHKTVLRDVASETFTDSYLSNEIKDTESPSGRRSFSSDSGLKEGSNSLIKLKRFFVPTASKSKRNEKASHETSCSVSYLTTDDCKRVRRTWKMACLPKNPQDVFPLMQFSEQFYGTVAVLEPRSKVLFTNFFVKSGKLTLMLHLIVSEVEAMVMENKLEHSKVCRDRIKRVLGKHKQANIDTEILIKGGKALLQALIARLGSTFEWKCLLCPVNSQCVCQSGIGADKEKKHVGITQYTSAYSAASTRKPLERDDAASWMLVYATIVYILENNGKYSFNAEQKARVYDICTRIDPELARYKLGTRPPPLSKTSYNPFPRANRSRVGSWLSKSLNNSPTNSFRTDRVPELLAAKYSAPIRTRTPSNPEVYGTRTPSNPEILGTQSGRREDPLPLYHSLDG